MIKRQRIKRDLTLQQLADMMETDRQYISKIENGKINMSLNYLDKILKQLKITTGEFFREYK